MVSRISLKSRQTEQMSVVCTAPKGLAQNHIPTLPHERTSLSAFAGLFDRNLPPPFSAEVTTNLVLAFVSCQFVVGS